MSVKIYDSLVIGAGITGAAIAYELQKLGQQVLLLEKADQPANATYYSYGGIPYWSGITPNQRQLCQESRALMSGLAQELEGVTEYRELDLLLTLGPADRRAEIEQNLSQCLTRPQYLTPQEAKVLEPLLNHAAIVGAFTVPHGHIHPEKTTQSYLQAFLRLGGKIAIEGVTSLIFQKERTIGVETSKNRYFSNRVILCAGALSRQLLPSLAINLPLYFSQALLLQTPPIKSGLRTLIMPARLQRLEMEAKAKTLNWQEPNARIQAEVLELGAIQFLDGHCHIGQISQLVTEPDYQPDRSQAEQKLRTAIASLLPDFAEVPGKCQHCLVAFSDSQNPLLGAVPHYPGLYLFTGFSSTLLYAPPLARHFAQWLETGDDQMIASLGNIQTEQ